MISPLLWRSVRPSHFYRRREARRFSPMSFAVFTIVVAVSVLFLLILVYLVARRWLR